MRRPAHHHRLPSPPQKPLRTLTPTRREIPRRRPCQHLRQLPLSAPPALLSNSAGKAHGGINQRGSLAPSSRDKVRVPEILPFAACAMRKIRCVIGKLLVLRSAASKITAATLDGTQQERFMFNKRSFTLTTMALLFVAPAFAVGPSFHPDVT